MEKWIPLIMMERAGLRLLSVTELRQQLAGKKDDAAIMFFDWHHKGGEMSFPTELKVIDLRNYDIHLSHPISSPNFMDIPKKISEGKMVMFDTEGLPTYGRKYRGDLKPGTKSLPLPPHLTVADFKKKLAGLGDKAFFAVKYKGNKFVSPDLLMNYNAETYPLANNKGQMVGLNLGMNGDILTFGLGTTMSTDWGPFSFSLEPKKTLGKIDESFVRSEVRQVISNLLK